MDSPMIGVILVVLVLLLARPLGWQTTRARVPLGLAGFLYFLALAMVLLAGFADLKRFWGLIGLSCQAFGTLSLLIGMFRLDSTEREQRRKARARGRHDAIHWPEKDEHEDESTNEERPATPGE